MVLLFIVVYGLLLFFTMIANGQGLLQGRNSLLVRPEPLLIKDREVQVTKQKPSYDCQAQMKYNSDKITVASTSRQPCSKPGVSGSGFGVDFFI